MWAVYKGLSQALVSITLQQATSQGVAFVSLSSNLIHTARFSCSSPGYLSNFCNEHSAFASQQSKQYSLQAIRSFSSSPIVSQAGKKLKQPVLVRDFILDSLYNLKYGYFASQAAVVGKIPKPIDFDKLWGRAGYTKLLSRLYSEIRASWLTPVELFQPWYGFALAEFIRRSHVSSQVASFADSEAKKSWLKPTSGKRKQNLETAQSVQKGALQVYEIGGGCGTCALNVLDYFEQKAPEIYKQLRYTSIEISESLAAEQRKTVYSKPQHQSKYKVEIRDAADLGAWGPPNEEPCFVIMLEVLDNLPHDRTFRSSRHDPWLETLVTLSDNSEPISRNQTISPPDNSSSAHQIHHKELLVPLRDPLLKRCLSALEPNDLDSSQEEPTKANLNGLLAIAKEFLGSIAQPPEGSEVLWAPTGALQLLETLYRARPNMCLIAADFDQLPDVRIEGKNAPLVASKAHGVTQDHSTYLVEAGSADIFFPTDFLALPRLNAAAAYWAGAGHVPLATSGSTREFMEQYGDVKRTRTRTGYNPLLEDYLNTRFFVSHTFPQPETNA